MATVKSREGRLAEKRREIASLRQEIKKKSGKTAEQPYEEREKRVRDAVALKEPDRVTVGYGSIGQSR